MTSPDQLTAAARVVLDRPSPEMTGIWPRAAAMLGRQALEIAIGRCLGLADGNTVSARSKLIALPYVVDRGVARRAAWAWSRLSNACHHHPYELPPVADELRDWLSVVDELVTTMRPDATTATPA